MYAFDRQKVDMVLGADFVGLMIPIDTKRDSTNINSFTGIKNQLSWSVLGKETQEQCMEEKYTGSLVVTTGTIVCWNLCNMNDSCNLYKHDATNLRNNQPVDTVINGEYYLPKQNATKIIL